MYIFPLHLYLVGVNKEKPKAVDGNKKFFFHSTACSVSNSVTVTKL